MPNYKTNGLGANSDPSPEEIMSFTDAADDVKNALTSEGISFSERFQHAVTSFRLLTDFRVNLTEFLHEIEEKIDQAKAALMEIGLPSDAIEQRLKTARNERDHRLHQHTFAHYRAMHEGVRARLSADEPVGMTQDAFRRFVLGNGVKIHAWVYEQFANDIKRVIDAPPEQADAILSEVRDTVHDFVIAHSNQVPDDLKPVTTEKIELFFEALRPFAGIDKKYFIPLPKAAVDGMLGVMVDGPQMQELFTDFAKIKNLPREASIRVIVAGKEISAYGSEAVFQQVSPYCAAPVSAHIVMAHYRTDNDVSNMLTLMTEGQCVRATARGNNADVTIFAQDGDHVRIEGLNVSEAEFLKHPMKYINHTFEFSSTEDANRATT